MDLREDELAVFKIKQLEGLGEGERQRKASGSFGAVYEVTMNGMPCIAKRLHDILVNQNVGERDRERMKRKFRDECVLLSRLRHPNVVQFLGVHYGRDALDLTLVMEYLHMDLEKCFRKYQNLPLSITITILLDVSYGLLHLHAQDPPVIHRDLTAANILLTPDMRAKIADLGVSKILDLEPAHLPGYTACPGTFAYMPPEALKPNPIYDVKLDDFSFGVLALYTANQEFPMVYHETELTPSALLEGKIQILKRQPAIDKLGSDHCLFGLITRCLLDDPKKRLSTVEINTELKHLSTQYPKNFHDVMEMHGELGKLTKERMKMMEQLSNTANEEEKIIVLTQHVKQYQMVVEKCQDEVDALREQERVNKDLMTYLAKTTEECNQKAFRAEQDLMRVGREKEALAEELQRVRDHNMMAARLQQEVEQREEMERRLIEIQGEKQQLQKQSEEAERMRGVLVKTELEQARMAREEEMGMWKRRAEEAEQQIWNWTDELVALREENKQIKEELDVRKAEAQVYQKDFHAEREDRERLAGQIDEEKVKYEMHLRQLQEELDRSYSELQLTKQISQEEKERLESSLKQFDATSIRLQEEIGAKSQAIMQLEAEVDQYRSELGENLSKLEAFQRKARLYKENERALEALRKERESLIVALRKQGSDQQDHHSSLPPRAKPHYENVKPKLSRDNRVNEANFTDGGPDRSTPSPTGRNSLTTDGVDDAVTCPGCKKKIRSENYTIHASSCEELIALVQPTRVRSDSDPSDSVNDIDIPFDPNLVCPKCKKQFREGEIQKYKKHFKSCI